MTVYLARLPVDLPALARAAGERGWTRGIRAAFDEGAALHHLLGEAFGPGVLQPFRLIVAPRAQAGTLYAYTHTVAEELRETASMVGLSEAAEAAIPPDSVATKLMPATWDEGRRIGFDIRLRPVVRLASAIGAPSDRKGARDHEFAKGAELDAFLAEGLRHSDRTSMEKAGRDRGVVYAEWFAARLGDAAEIEKATLASFRRTRARRGDNAVEGPDVVIQGTLRIRDGATFAEHLQGGVGRHKAYGFGMLLLRPAGRPTPRA